MSGLHGAKGRPLGSALPQGAERSHAGLRPPNASHLLPWAG